MDIPSINKVNPVSPEDAGKLEKEKPECCPWLTSRIDIQDEIDTCKQCGGSLIGCCLCIPYIKVCCFVVSWLFCNKHL